MGIAERMVDWKSFGWGLSMESWQSASRVAPECGSTERTGGAYGGTLADVGNEDAKQAKIHTATAT